MVQSTLGDIVAFQEINTYIEQLAKGIEVVVGRGAKAIEEAQIREQLLIDLSVQDKNSMLGMFFGMHYKPQYRPTDNVKQDLLGCLYRLLNSLHLTHL